MKNMKFWRTALVATLVLTVMLSVTGGTIAWFTDEVTSSGNKIESGTLDIQLFQMDKNNQWVDISESKAPLFTYTNWEPGYTTYQVLKVKNNGSLALKWKAHFANENGEIGELAEAIDVYVNTDKPARVPAGRETVEGWKLEGTLAQFIENIETVTVGTLAAGEEAWLSLGLKMRESAGNEYQGLTLGDFDVRVLATQLEAEQDSFDSDYDKDATYPSVVSSAADLKEVLNKGGHIILTEDVEVSEVLELTEDTVLDLNGKTITNVGSGHVFRVVADVTVKNGTIKATQSGYTFIVGKNTGEAGNLTIENGSFYGVTTAVSVTYGTATINGGSFEAKAYQGAHDFTLNCIDRFYPNEANFVVKGGAFYKFNPANNASEGTGTDYVPEGYTVKQIGDWYYVVEDENAPVKIESSNTDEIGNGMENGEDVTMTDDTEKEADQTNPYGGTTGYIQHGGTFDGGNNTLTVNDATWGIMTYGGTIKNVTIKGVERGIVLYAPTENVILDNVTLDDAGYAINTAEHPTETVSLIVSNSTINGWTSFAGISSASFTNCSFGENSNKYWQNMGYDQDYDRLVRPYTNTLFEACQFEKGFYIDLSALEAGCQITVKDCTVNGTKITAENYASLLTAIELPSGRTLVDCVIFQ